MLENALAIATGSWAVVMAVSPTLQIRRILQRRSSDDVSIPYFLVLLLGFALWALYGVSKRDLVLIIPNSVAFCVAVATILVARRFR